MNISKAINVVDDVLQHIQANHRVELPSQPLEVLPILEIALMDGHVWTVQQSCPQPRKMLLFEVTHRVILTAPGQMHAQVADPRADCESSRPEERRHDRSHPITQSRRVG